MTVLEMLLQLNWHHNSMQSVLFIDKKRQGISTYKATGKIAFVLFLFHIYSFAQLLWRRFLPSVSHVMSSF